MEQEELEWYALEHAYLVFLLTVDLLGLSMSLGTMLRSPVSSDIFTFAQRQRFNVKPIKGIKLL